MNSLVTMLGGFGLGVPTVLTTVVAPSAVIAVSTAGYGAVVLEITATRLPLSADADNPAT